MKFFWTVLRVLLGAIFIYASLYKIGSPSAFAHQVYNFKLLPVWAINPVALVLPWLQLFCGVHLILNRWPVAASFWILLMMLVFQVAVASALVRGLDISCGCFKSGGSPATWVTFARDMMFLVLAGTVFFQERQKQCS